MSLEIINYDDLINKKIYNEQIEEIKLAKYVGKNYCSFNEDEISMLDTYWDTAYNKSWLYIDDSIVENMFGYKNEKNMMYNFSVRIKNDFEENIEYQIIDSDHEIVRNFCSRTNGSQKKFAHNKKHYIITGETFKQLLMSSNSLEGKRMKKYYIKVENLARLTINIISNCIKILSKKQVEKQQKELEEHMKALQIAESKNLQLTSFIKENAVVKEDGWIYIATTRQYSQNNIYKLGKTEELNPRMGNYQTGRSKSDAYYYVYVYKTCKMGVLETLLKKLLEKYKEDKKKELFVLPWKLLHEYVDYICSNFNECFIFELNQLITDNLDYGNRNEVPEIPEPLDLSQALVEQNTDLEFEEEIEDDVEEKIIKNEDEDSGFASDDDTLENNESIESIESIESNSNVSSSSSNKVAKTTKTSKTSKTSKTTKEKIRCRPCGNSYPQKEFDLLPDGNYYSTCKNCAKTRLDSLVNEIIYKLDRIKRSRSFTTSPNIKANRIRMNEVTHELHQLKNIDIYKKKTITETTNFKRCGHEHSNEFERWLPKSKFSISSGKFKSGCKDCFNASERKRVSKSK